MGKAARACRSRLRLRGRPRGRHRLRREARPGLAGPLSSLHRYTARCAWNGSTGVGHDAYERAHDAAAPPAEAALRLSADPAFRGDPALMNPEQLVVLAAASCQLLSFLAVAARARIDLVAYEDEGEGVMPEDDGPIRITEIVLRPRLTVGGEVPERRLARLVQLAHEECFVANSLKTDVRVEPTFLAA